MEKVGFIGLGTMGGSMAFNVLSAGFEMCVQDVNPEKVKLFAQSGVKTADSPGEVARWSDVVVTMLPDVPQVEEVYLGKKGLLSGAHAGLYLIDCSTVDPDCSRRISQAAQETGAIMFDAPVGGSPLEAAGGTLVMLAGGDKKDITACKNVLDAMGERTLMCGPVGSGSAMKLANNLITIVFQHLAVEGLNLAELAGVNTTRLAELLKINMPKVAEGIVLAVMAKEDLVGFNTRLAAKDLRHALKLADELGAPVPLGALTKSLSQININTGSGNLAVQSIKKLYESDR
jgi:2-hydroxy-3-oxopropionate reductase